MFFSRILCFATLGCMVLAGGAGCQSMMKSSDSSATAMPQKAVVISGGQSGSTVILFPSSDGEHVEMMSTTGAPVCAQCQADALKYFKTGELVPKCSVCGATRTPVTMTPQITGHN